MADATGNVLNVPGTSSKGPTTDDEILYSYAKFTQKGVTLLKDNGVLRTGTVLKVSGTPKKYTGAAKADVANAIGVLRKDVDTTGIDKLGNVVISGLIKGSKLKYTDDQDGLTAGELATLATALGGKYNAVFDFISF